LIRRISEIRRRILRMSLTFEGGTRMKKTGVLVCIVATLSLVMSSAMLHGKESSSLKPTTIAIDHKNKSITFAGVVTAEKWQAYVHPVDKYAEKGFDPDHWHLIISGTQANPSVGRVPVFAAWATDVEVSEALAAIGAKAETSHFSVKSYNERLTKDSPHPDYVPKGSPISVYITWNEKSGNEKTVMQTVHGKWEEGVCLVGRYIHPTASLVCMVAPEAKLQTPLSR
jgi:hypothetical protein